MITVGIDLAAKSARTALATIKWSDATATLQHLTDDTSDEDIVQAMTVADKTGIDCPLGWPEPFIDFVVAHRANRITPRASDEGPNWRQQLVMRRTDLVVQELLQLTPLSVAADKIAHVALRCAVLLSKLEAAGFNVDRSGVGQLVEVYPAASLKSWLLPHQHYKRPANLVALNLLTDQLLASAPWLNLANYAAVVRQSDHAFDAVVAALTARAASTGQIHETSEADHAKAETEGWIAIPCVPLGKLL